MDERTILLENYSDLHSHNKVFFDLIKRHISQRVKKYSYEDFKWDMNILCHTIFRICFFVYGFLQSFALHDALVKDFHHDNIFILFFSYILGFLPLLGTFAGIYGSIVGWGWDLTYSLFIFITPYFIANGPLWMIICIDIYKDNMRWKAERKNI